MCSTTTSTSDSNIQDLEMMKRQCVSLIDEKLEELNCDSMDNFSSGHLRKVKKDDMVAMLCDALSLLSGLTCMVSESSYAPRGVTAELLDAQKKIISLQSELLECKEEKLDSVKTVVQSSVCETVEKEMKTFSSVVQSGCKEKPISQTLLKKVIQDVVTTEDRSKNVMVFGLSEEDNEDVTTKVNELLSAIGEKPRTDVCRVGKKNSDGKPRPVKVVTSSRTVAEQLLLKGKRLKLLEKYKRVFVNPDRSPEQREQRRELVKEVKRLTEDDKEKRHFIRNGKVCSVARTLST